MVQKSPETKRRGRPRSYEPDIALARAMETFWKSGYAATTLDDLSAATGMNRPSLYAAFGDKQDIYVKAYRKYRARVRDEFEPIIEESGPVRLVLRRIFEAASELYLSGPDGPRGCFSVVTAASEAVADPQIRKLVVEAIAALDETFAALFTKAIARGELAPDSNPLALAKVATATIHTLAIRARIHAPRDELQALIDAAVSMLCGPADPPARRHR
ncbi:TetR/AcrR family transcriptional regulator [Methylocapsa sp. S129]|uniref:TetR/AcrR family transcriptional regulator n=1 Tax=Methylocapsa sp. S129 TaxID=1641869 RepID=UPI00131DDB5D|nr:TetR/AcrR family transcriptional regulator [Methylocapsa sp. S129]